jgi:hypothetical protein
VRAFDGSDVDDWTAIRLETMDGYQFTPTYRAGLAADDLEPGGVGRQDPARRGPRRGGSHLPHVPGAADVLRPPRLAVRDRDLGLEHGEDVVVEWATYRAVQMHAALERTVTDLTTKALTHDGCPITALHVGNARKLAKPGDRYILGKPSASPRRSTRR